MAKLPEGWQQLPIRGFADLVRRKVEVVPDEQYFQIGIRSWGKGIFHKEGVLGRELGDKRVFWVEPDDFVVNIVFAWEGAVALVSDQEKGMCASHRFPTFVSNRSLCEPEYLLRFFQSEAGTELLKSVSPGGAGRNKTLNQSTFLKLKLPLPPLAEQRKIAAILSTWDDAIKLAEKYHMYLTYQKTGLMQHLLTAESVEGSSKHLRASSFADLGKWQITTLSKVARISAGATPSRAEPERYFVNGEYPWVKTMDLNNSHIYVTDEKITKLALQETSCPLLSENTVLVAMYGGLNQIGRTGILKIKASINQAISALVANPELVMPEYLLHWLNANVGLWKRFAASSRKDPNITSVLDKHL